MTVCISFYAARVLLGSSSAGPSFPASLCFFMQPQVTPLGQQLAVLENDQSTRSACFPMPVPSFVDIITLAKPHKNVLKIRIDGKGLWTMPLLHPHVKVHIASQSERRAAARRGNRCGDADVRQEAKADSFDTSRSTPRGRVDKALPQLATMHELHLCIVTLSCSKDAFQLYVHRSNGETRRALRRHKKLNSLLRREQTLQQSSTRGSRGGSDPYLLDFWPVQLQQLPVLPPCNASVSSLFPSPFYGDTSCALALANASGFPVFRHPGMSCRDSAKCEENSGCDRLQEKANAAQRFSGHNGDRMFASKARWLAWSWSCTFGDTQLLQQSVKLRRCYLLGDLAFRKISRRAISSQQQQDRLSRSKREGKAAALAARPSRGVVSTREEITDDLPASSVEKTAGLDGLLGDRELLGDLLTDILEAFRDEVREMRTLSARRVKAQPMKFLDTPDSSSADKVAENTSTEGSEDGVEYARGTRRPRAQRPSRDAATMSLERENSTEDLRCFHFLHKQMSLETLNRLRCGFSRASALLQLFLLGSAEEAEQPTKLLQRLTGDAGLNDVERLWKTGAYQQKLQRVQEEEENGTASASHHQGNAQWFPGVQATNYWQTLNKLASPAYAEHRIWRAFFSLNCSGPRFPSRWWRSAPALETEAGTEEDSDAPMHDGKYIGPGGKLRWHEAPKMASAVQPEKGSLASFDSDGRAPSPSRVSSAGEGGQSIRFQEGGTTKRTNMDWQLVWQRACDISSVEDDGFLVSVFQLLAPAGRQRLLQRLLECLEDVMGVCEANGDFSRDAADLPQHACFSEARLMRLSLLSAFLAVLGAAEAANASMCPLDSEIDQGGRDWVPGDSAETHEEAEAAKHERQEAELSSERVKGPPISGKTPAAEAQEKGPSAAAEATCNDVGGDHVSTAHHAVDSRPFAPATVSPRASETQQVEKQVALVAATLLARVSPLLSCSVPFLRRRSCRSELCPSLDRMGCAADVPELTAVKTDVLLQRFQLFLYLYRSSAYAALPPFVPPVHSRGDLAHLSLSAGDWERRTQTAETGTGAKQSQERCRARQGGYENQAAQSDCCAACGRTLSEGEGKTAAGVQFVAPGDRAHGEVRGRQKEGEQNGDVEKTPGASAADNGKHSSTGEAVSLLSGGDSGTPTWRPLRRPALIRVPILIELLEAWRFLPPPGHPARLDILSRLLRMSRSTAEELKSLAGGNSFLETDVFLGRLNGLKAELDCRPARLNASSADVAVQHREKVSLPPPLCLSVPIRCPRNCHEGDL